MFHTNSEALSGQWFSKTHLESLYNFTWKCCNEDKKDGSRRVSRSKSKKTLTDHSLEKASNYKTKINLLFKFNKFCNCSICTDLMSVMFKAWLTLQLYLQRLLERWELFVFWPIKSLVFHSLRGCILSKDNIPQFIVEHLTIFWETLIMVPMKCFKKNISVLSFSLLNGFILSSVEV